MNSSESSGNNADNDVIGIEQMNPNDIKSRVFSRGTHSK